MSYTNKYLLLKILKFQNYVQDILQEHKGLPLTKVYTIYVKDEFDISYSTFRNWIGRNVKKELKELDKKEASIIINQ